MLGPAPALPAAAPNPAKRIDELPDSQAKTLLVSACSGCHPLDVTLGTRKSQDEWRDTVNDMLARGAQIFPDEVDILVTYLTRELGPTTD